MSVIVIGTSHQIADTRWRGRLAFSADAARVWLAETIRHPALDELFVLSTCNRVEIYASTSDDVGAERALRQAMRERSGEDLLAPGPRRLRHAGADACLHLCRVACGLDSMLVGEAEILGQLRAAATVARDAGALGSRLQRLIEMAVAAGARARSETAIGVGATSLAGAAVSLAERTLGDLAGRHALVIGAGHAGRLALARLTKRRAGRVIVANRSREAAEAIAAPAGADVISLDQIARVVRDVDVVIAAAQLPQIVVTAAMLRDRDPSQPIAIVDLSVPPIVASDVGAHRSVTLCGMEHLRVFVQESADRRAREIPRVEAIARREAARLWARLAALEPRAARADRPRSAA